MRAIFINEKYTEQSDPVKDMGIGLKGAKAWTAEMVDKLQNHKVTQLGGSIPVENVKIEMNDEYAADVTGSIQAGNIRLDLYFNIRDERRWNDPIPKWKSEVTISSPAKRGYFTKSTTGKNTSPESLLKLLSDMLNLKYKR